MKKLTSKNKTYLGYILYGIVLTVCLLYLFFPSDAFRDYLITSVNTMNPRFQFSVEDARPSLPFGVKFRQAELSLKEDPDLRLFIAESLMIRPEIWSFLKGKSGFIFSCDAYGGNLRGHLRFSENGFTPPFSTSIKLKDIIIDDYSYLSALIGRNSSGVLGGAVTYKGLTDGTGEANLKITDGSMELLEPFLNLDAIEFDELLVKLVLKKQKIELSHVKLKGRKIQGTMAGTIKLKRDFLKSSLDMKGTVELLTTLFNSDTGNPDTGELTGEPLKMPFAVYGTITEPKLELM